MAIWESPQPIFKFLYAPFTSIRVFALIFDSYLSFLAPASDCYWSFTLWYPLDSRLALGRGSLLFKLSHSFVIARANTWRWNVTRETRPKAALIRAKDAASLIGFLFNGGAVKCPNFSLRNVSSVLILFATALTITIQLTKYQTSDYAVLIRYESISF